MLHSESDPTFYYGWIIVFACSVIGFCFMTVTFSFGVFFTPLATEFGLSILAALFVGLIKSRIWDDADGKDID